MNELEFQQHRANTQSRTHQSRQRTTGVIPGGVRVVKKSGGKPVLKRGLFNSDTGPVLVSGARMVEPGDAGFVSPSPPQRNHVSYWAVLWNEFLGSFMIALAGRLFVGFFGGSTFAATVPTLYGTAFANGFVFFGAMAVFGAVSGGHFNAAITLSVMLIELFARFGWFGKFRWGRLVNGGGDGDGDGDDGSGSSSLIDFGMNMGEETTMGMDIEYNENGNGGTMARSRTMEPHPWRTWFGLLPYFVVQFAAFLIAALLVWAFLPGSPRSSPVSLGIPYVTNTVNDGKTFGLELVASFMYLVGYVLLLKMLGGSRQWLFQVVRAMAFGLWYFALIVVFAPWAGAVWNPTLWLAFAIVSGRWVDWWILMWPALISAVATAFFCLLHWWIGQTSHLRDLAKISAVARETPGTLRRFGRQAARHRRLR